MVKQLIYKSQSTEQISTEIVDTILSYAHRFNARHNITGLLLFSENTFMQFLEGPPKAVDSVFERICNDQRHTNIRILYTGYADLRTYPDWLMMAYSRRIALHQGQSEAYIVAQNVVDPVPDYQMTDIGAFMKSFCENYFPESKPGKSIYH